MRRFNDSENVNVSEEMKMQGQINLVRIYVKRGNLQFCNAQE